MRLRDGRSSTLLLALPLVLSVHPPIRPAQETQPLPKELREAKTAYIMKSGVDPRVLDRLTKELADWKRFTLTDDLKAADIVIILSEEQLEAKGGSAPTRIVLTIAAGLGGPPLWTDKERGGITTGAVANLVKRLKDRFQKADKAGRTVNQTVMH